jgi:hypothetical protein
MSTTAEPAAEKQIHLDLRRHCIETEIKKLHDSAVGAYFKAGADKPALEARIELLKLALEAFDFPALRSRYPELCGGSSSAALLFLNPQGNPQLRLGSALIGTAPETRARAKSGLSGE